MTIDMAALRQELKRDEGVRLKPYIDTVGKVTVGCGRNIQDVGISSDEMELMLTNDIARSIRDLDTNLPWWSNLNEPRRRVLVNMCFNMGIGSLEKGTGLLGFKNTLAFVKNGNYQSAAAGMRNSKWYRQVGDRAERLAKMMETGNG